MAWSNMTFPQYKYKDNTWKVAEDKLWIVFGTAVSKNIHTILDDCYKKALINVILYVYK